MTRLVPDPPLSQCGTLKEIAERIGITDQALYNLRDRYSTFPTPLRTIGKAAVYWMQEVEAWHAEHGYGYERPAKRRVRTRA